MKWGGGCSEKKSKIMAEMWVYVLFFFFQVAKFVHSVPNTIMVGVLMAAISVSYVEGDVHVRRRIARWALFGALVLRFT